MRCACGPALLLTLCLIACDSNDPVDAGSAPDSGTDAGSVEDAGTDAGPPEDAGTPAIVACIDEPPMTTTETSSSFQGEMGLRVGPEPRSVEGATLDLVPYADPSTPIATTMSDALGRYMVEFPLEPTGFDGFLRITHPVHRSHYLRLSNPFLSGFGWSPNIFDDASWEDLHSDFGATPIAGRGVVVAAIGDCINERVVGAEVTLEGADGMTQIIHTRDDLPNPAGTTTLDGNTYIFGVPAGTVTLRVTRLGRTLVEMTFDVEEESFHYVFGGPTRRGM